MGKGWNKSEDSQIGKTKAAVDCPARATKCLGSVHPVLRSYHEVAVPTAMRNSHNVRSSAVGKQLKQKKFNSPPPYSISSGLTCGSSTTSLLMISPGPVKES